jgi:ribosome-associated toxin RatA of RatAB toxin-antitoxin module
MIKKEGFEFYCEANIIIECPTEVVYQAMVDMKTWPKLLPHVKAVNVLYNDGRYQEFTMIVDSGTKAGDLTVRSVRLCDQLNLQIDLFQADPPPFLKHHVGGWKFIPLNKTKCEVLLFHEWNLNHKVAEDIFQKADKTYQEALSVLMEGHVKDVMKNWKRVLETKPSILGATL